MKIDYLKANGFGKMINKDIEFKDNINVVYGKNESGKSTMLKFISSMLYGVSRNKNGKDIPDFERYKPWKTEEYSGKIKYYLDSGESFEVYREFRNKAPIIYNDRLQDISDKFTFDKQKGSNFFEEQTGVDENTFLSTAIIEQEGVRLDKSSQNTIVQKISNLVSSGDESISFKKTVDKINKEQVEKVGNDRTSQRPINLVKENLEKLNLQKDELKEYLLQFTNLSEKTEDLKIDLENEEEKLKFLKDVKENLEKNNVKITEVEVNRGLLEDNEIKIVELKEKFDKKGRRQIESEKPSNRPLLILSILTFIVTIVLLVLKINPIIIGVGGLVFLGFLISYIISNVKFNKAKKFKLDDLDEFEDRLTQEIEILQRNKEDLKNKIKEKEKVLDEEESSFNDDLKLKYKDTIHKEYFKEILNMEFNELLVTITAQENAINVIKFNLQSCENEFNEMNKKLENLSNLEEEIIKAQTQKEELDKLNNSYELAKNCMESAYDKVRDCVSPKFENNLSEIIENVSNGKYSKINFNDKDGLVVETNMGNYVSCERLSTGTIDQMYLSLRLSALQEISKEKMPIILDETFAYFDNYRLENILRFLNDNFKDNQIIILTCSNREKEALNSLNITYNTINLEN